MDMPVLALIAFIIVASFLSLFITRVLPRTKTYEEALAEKRQYADKLYSGGKSSTGQRKSNKPTGAGAGKQSSEKRDKKAAAKEVRRRAKEELTADSEDAVSEEVHSSENGNSPKHETHKKLSHVEFSDTEVIVAGASAAGVGGKAAKRNRRPSGILLNKNEQIMTAVTAVSASAQFIQQQQQSGVEVVQEPLNHFEEIQPKDDVEIKKMLKKKAISKKDVSLSPKIDRTDSPKKDNKSKGNNKKQNKDVANNNNNNSAFQHNNHADLKDEQPSVNMLMHSLGRAELTRSEIQLLIDYLLNKQQDTIAVNHSDWSDDIVQKLKKQLGEKDKQLAEEQDAVVSLQQKLRELKAEMNAERKSVHDELLQRRTESATLKRDMTDLLERNQVLKAQLVQMQQTVLAEKKLDAENAHIQLAQLQEVNSRLQSELQAQKAKESSAAEEWERRFLQKEDECRYYQREKEQMLHDKEQLAQTAERSCQELMQLKAGRHDYKVELLNLTNALHSAKDEVNAVNQENQNHRVANVDLAGQVAELKAQLRQYAVNADEHGKRATDLSGVIGQLKASIAERDSQLADFNETVQRMKEAEVQLNAEITAYKDKNNELRTRNWKLVEALQTNGQPTKNATDTTKTTVDSERAVKHRVLKLFEDMNPNESVLKSKESFGEWYDEFLERTLAELNALPNDSSSAKSKQPVNNHTEVTPALAATAVATQSDSPAPADVKLLLENAKLQATVVELKKIVAETENVLVSLEVKGRETETHWKRIVDAKNDEIFTLKLSQNSMEETM